MPAEGIIVAAISAVAVIGTSAITILFTKKKERDAAWREKRLAYYEAFIKAASSIVGSPPAAAKIDFANAVNNLHLVGSDGVIESLHRFCDAIAESRLDPVSKDEHDRLWSRLVWEIRRDLGTAPVSRPSSFRARLWASGVGQNVDSRPWSLNSFTEWSDESDRVFDRL